MKSIRAAGVLGCLFFAFAATGAAAGERLVFLLAGQSNMAGRGAVEAGDKATDPAILVWGQAGAWRPAAEPLHFDKPKMAGVGPGLAFARAVKAARPGVEVGLVPAAMGGSSLDEWAPGGKLFTAAVERTRAALRGGGKLAGILWHQGESDCGNPEKAASYAKRASEVLTALRKELGAENAPLVVGELGEFLYTRAKSPESRVVNAQIAMLPGLLPRSALVKSAGLVDKGDGLHFDAASARELGRRYAEAWLELASE